MANSNSQRISENSLRIRVGHGDKPDGCATFFKQKKFSLHKCHTIDFSRPNVTLMDRNNVALITFLVVRDHNRVQAKNKSTLCVANTHLLFNMRRGDIKLTQIAHLFAELDHLCAVYNPERLNTILCGDFNSQPFSPLYQLVTSGELRFQGLQKSLVSGQSEKGRAPKRGDEFGEILFTEETGLSHDCRWRHLTPQQHQLDSKSLPIKGRNDDSIISQMEKPGYLRHKFPFRSCYTHLKDDGSEEISTCHDRGSSNVDYIFGPAPRVLCNQLRPSVRQ